MPGDNVLFGELDFWGHHRFPPRWVEQPRTGHNNESLAFVLMPNGEGLITGLVPFHNDDNRNVQEYRCFIITPRNTVYGAFLENNNNALHAIEHSRVFVRILGHHDPVYSGVLHLADGHPPAWLP